MTNQPGTMNNHKKRPGIMNNQPGTLNNHVLTMGGGRGGNKQKFYRQTDTTDTQIEKVLIFRYKQTFFVTNGGPK